MPFKQKLQGGEQFRQGWEGRGYRMKLRALVDWLELGMFSVICFALSPILPELRTSHMPSKCFTLRDPIFRRVFGGSMTFPNSLS